MMVLKPENKSINIIDEFIPFLLERGYKSEIYEKCYIKFINIENIIIDFQYFNNYWVAYKYKEQLDKFINIEFTQTEKNTIGYFCKINFVK